VNAALFVFTGVKGDRGYRGEQGEDGITVRTSETLNSSEYFFVLKMVFMKPLSHRCPTQGRQRHLMWPLMA